MVTEKENSRLQELVEDILSAIIDDWYERVSGYYITEGDAEQKPELEESVQLKRFHDENGHRIKFNKDDLDFTYGLRSDLMDDAVGIEISVNNKVENFDYENFREQLFSHYRKAGGKTVGKPASAQDLSFEEIFQLETEISEAFVVERRSQKADIMRLSFRIRTEILENLIEDGDSTKQLIESYCVSPFRSIYAKVYRSTPA